MIGRLKGHYRSLFDSGELPWVISHGCKPDLARFERRIQGISSDTELQILRIDALLRLLADRKTLASWQELHHGK